MFRPFYVLHTAQNVNKIFPGFHDNVKAIKSRGKSWPGLKSACYISKVQAPVVQKLDNAIQRINRYPEDRYYESQLHYPLDSNLSSGYYYPPFEQVGPELQLQIMFQ